MALTVGEHRFSNIVFINKTALSEKFLISNNWTEEIELKPHSRFVWNLVSKILLIYHDTSTTINKST